MKQREQKAWYFLAAALLGTVIPLTGVAVSLPVPAFPAKAAVSSEETAQEQELPEAIPVYVPQEKNTFASLEEPAVEQAAELSFGEIQLQLQNPELPNGCEVTSLSMVLTAAGYPVDKLELYEYLPREDFAYSGSARLGPDLNVAFAGDAAGASGGWYCLEGPILEAGDAWIEAMGGGAQMEDFTGIDQNGLDTLLEQGTPLVAWVTQEYALPTYANYFTWTLPDGTQYIPYDNLHCVVLAGMDGDAYRIADPIRGWQLVDKETFWQSFDAMGRRAVTVDVSLEGRMDMAPSLSKLGDGPTLSLAGAVPASTGGETGCFLQEGELPWNLRRWAC